MRACLTWDPGLKCLDVRARVCVVCVCVPHGHWTRFVRVCEVCVHVHGTHGCCRLLQTKGATAVIVLLDTGQTRRLLEAAARRKTGACV